MSKLLENWQNIKTQYGRFFPAVFFILGFIFDVFTLSRVDDWLAIAQQATYLILCIYILRKKISFDAGLWAPTGRWASLWAFHNEALHFILGSLLSVYALFYFLSASFSTSFLFLLIIFSVLVINEFPSFQNKGMMFKYALFSLCLFSFFAAITPTVLGFLGPIPFFISILLAGTIIWTNYTTVKENLPTENALLHRELNKSVLYPGIAVLGLVTALYLVRMLPPIPLSVQYIGIYHNVEKIRAENNATQEQQFALSYQRPWWKFWQNGAQDFHAYAGDRVYCFVRIFSPANFKDKIVFHWLLKTAKGWQTQDRITSEITGGRDQGFRSFVFKSNYEPGDWRVQVKTTDGREIGRIDFTLSKSIEGPPTERVFRTDLH